MDHRGKSRKKENVVDAGVGDVGIVVGFGVIGFEIAVRCILLAIYIVTDGLGCPPGGLHVTCACCKA